ncbi:MAG: tail fiber domain-containing protein [Candidatus Neomarinimicrobiota bacterium]
MKAIALMYSVLLITITVNLMYSQDIINETGKDGLFIVRTADQDTLMLIKDRNVNITGELRIATMSRGSDTDPQVVWDTQDKALKVIPLRVFSEVSPLSEPLSRINGHSILSNELLSDDNTSFSILETAAVTWNIFSTDYGYIKLGPANANWGHIYTDRPKFVFNVPLYSGTGKFSSAVNDLQLHTNGKTRITVLKNGGNVGIGTSNPLSQLSVGGDGLAAAAIWGETSERGGRGVYGYASNGSIEANYGGYFRSNGRSGRGVQGYAIGLTGRGVYGIATGGSGKGVDGYASNSGDVTNYGGYFRANGSNGRGVYGYASGSSGHGVNGYAFGINGRGGSFEANGGSGRGVYGYASNIFNVTNYGGYFQAAGSYGRGVYGYASNTGSTTNYGGYFEAAGIYGRGVYGLVTGSSGVGMYGYASNSGSVTNYGGYFLAQGSSGRGVYGRAKGTNGKGVVGRGDVPTTSYDFDAIGAGVNYGSTSSIRWKNDIVEIDRPLEKISELRGVYFIWDEEHGGHHDVGMIAEEVGKVLPEIVVYEENGIDADGMDYSKLTPLLVEAIKAQQKLIDELTLRVQVIEAQ